MTALFCTIGSSSKQDAARHGPLSAGLSALIVFAVAVSSIVRAEGLTLSWREKPARDPRRSSTWLYIHGDHFPGDIEIHYLEAYCRADSTDADWREHTVVGHRTELTSASQDGKRLELQCTLADGVTVKHVITAGQDEVDFQLLAHNPTENRSEVHWAQPCARIGQFCGRGPDDTEDKYAYIEKSFIVVDGQLARLPTQPWATQARYTPGQVWCPAHVPRSDVNPRPLSDLVPSHGLIGCLSDDEKLIWATAWEPYQEVFQGVIRCLHSDFRLGGLAAGESKQIRGKIYIVPNDVDALLARYRRDFPEHATSVPAGRITTVAGDGGPADVGHPFGVEFGPDGKLYVTEVGNHRVRRLEADGQLTTVAGTGEPGYEGDSGPASKAKLNEPYEVRFDDAGNIYFVEMQNHIVRRVDARSGLISTVAGTGEGGFNGDTGRATEIQLNRPHSIALDSRGSLYIADIGNHRIRRVDLNDGSLVTIAGTGERQLPRDGQRAHGNPILGPRALCIDGRTLWIALRQGHSVWRIDLDRGLLRHVAGTGEQGYSGDGGPALQATFNGPKGIAVGPDGNVDVVDTENQVIRRIFVRSGLIQTIAGSGPGARGFGGDDGPADMARMDRPHGICVDSTGDVYIGDTNNHRVRKVQWSGSAR